MRELSLRRLLALGTLVGSATVVALQGCTSSSLAPLPLSITMTTSRTSAAPGDTIVFVATVQGGNLLGLDVAYGDNVADQYGTSGARTGKVTFRHAYGAPGNYTVNITVTDAVAGQKTASAEVRIM